LRNWAESVRRQELERYRGRLSRLSERDLEVVEHLTRSLLGKLLHEPTVALKQAADTPRGARLADAVAELFRLEPGATPPAAEASMLRGPRSACADPARPAWPPPGAARWRCGRPAT
jgi:glutamyl-tRNA reductase